MIVRLLTNTRLIFLFLAVGYFSLPIFSMAIGSPVNQIQFHNQLLSIDVENLHLETVLQQIADEANIDIVFYGALNQEISMSLSEISVEDALKRLLSKCNFSFEYKKTSTVNGREQIVLSKAVVFAKDANKNTADSIFIYPETEITPFTTEPPMQTMADIKTEGNNMEDSGQRVGKGIFLKIEDENIRNITENEFFSQIQGRTEPLSLGYTGGPDLRSENADLTDMQGVRITGLGSSNVLQNFGLQIGDIVQDINGVKTTTPLKMAQALHRAVSNPGSKIRIEVERNNTIEPHYIELGPTTP